MKQFKFKKYQQGGKQPIQVLAIKTEKGYTPVFEVNEKGVIPLVDMKQLETLPDDTMFEAGLFDGTNVQVDTKNTKGKFKWGDIKKELMKQPKQFKFGGVQSANDMVLLDHDGKPQMYLQGGELVISIKETQKLVDLASSSSRDNTEAMYELGKTMHDIRMKQRKRDGY
jgi:hypothetical protein